MEDAEINDLREESRRLEEQRRELESRLYSRSNLDRGGKRQLESREYGRPDRDEGVNKRQRSDSGPRPKIMSKIASVQSTSLPSPPATAESFPGDRWNPNDDSGWNVTKPEPREVEKRPESLQRNRRMLGALMGHLNTAKRNLERDSTIEVQESINSTVIEKHRIESERIEKISREENEKEIELRDQLLLRQFKNDVALSAASWKKNLLSTMSYCFTEAKPRVAWLPGVTDASVRPFVDLTKRQLEVEALIEARSASDELKLKELDDEYERKRMSRVADRPRIENISNDADNRDDVERNGDVVERDDEHMFMKTRGSPLEDGEEA